LAESEGVALNQLINLAVAEKGLGGIERHPFEYMESAAPGVCQPSRRRRSLRCLNAQRGDLADILLAFGVPGIVRGLHANAFVRRRRPSGRGK
jgi:hypothetical protein